MYSKITTETKTERGQEQTGLRREGFGLVLGLGLGLGLDN